MMMGIIGADATPSAVGGTYLLDLIGTSARAGFSVRKIVSAWSGNCATIRRASDDTTQDIGFSADVFDSSAATTFTGANDGFIRKWFDQTGNGRYVEQTTNGSQPKIINTGSIIQTVNTKPSPLFDGSDDVLPAVSTWAAVSNYISSSAYTVIGIVRGASGAASSGVFYATKGAWGESGGYVGSGFSTTPSNQFIHGQFDGGSPAAAIGISYAATMVFVAQYDGTNVRAWVNGGAVTSAAAGVPSSMTGTFQIGKVYTAASLDGNVLELVAYNTALSLSDINTLGNNMATFAGTTWTTAT